MNQILIVSRNFPPAGSVGVQRITKFVKYLPEFNWHPIVLTGHRGEFGLRHDKHLARDVKNAEVFRCWVPDIYSFSQHLLTKFQLKNKSAISTRLYKPRGPWHPKSWIVPDSQIFWAPVAMHTVKRIANKYKWKIVLATVSPYTNAIIAYYISRLLGIPLVIDYRDALTNAFFSPRRPKYLLRFEQNLEAKIFSYASSIISLSPIPIEIPRRLATYSPPIHLIENGYDEEDFLGLTPADLPYFSIVHTGNLSSERSAAPILGILAQTLKTDPSQKNKIHFWQIGTIDKTVEEQLNTAPNGIRIHHVPPVSLREALSYQLGADLLLVQSAGENTPAKIYQYLRSGRPILAVFAEGINTWKSLVTHATIGFSCNERECQSASNFLLRLITHGSRQSYPVKPEVYKYSNRELTKQLADILTQTINTHDNLV
jgi:hypothetical protein